MNTPAPGSDSNPRLTSKGKLLVTKLLLVAALHISPARADQSLYAIGNSLTAEILPYSIPDLASQQGETFNVGFHTISGASLDFIVASTPPATLDLALQSHAWTNMSVQPYPGATSTLASDIVAIRTLVSHVSAGSASSLRLFIYSAWPSQTSFGASGFATYWRSPVPNDDTQPTVLKRAYADHLHARLVAEFGAVTSVHVIPVGDVLALLDDAIRAGQIDGITDISQLYTDVHHTGDVGQFIAALTVYATVFRKSPEGLAIPGGYIQGSAPARLTPALAMQLESLVWRVVNSDSRTGVNAAPVAIPQTLSTLNTTALQIVLGASDREGSGLAYAVVGIPAHGRLNGLPPALTYMPDPGYQGADSFSFKASDGGLHSEAATINILITSAQDSVDGPESSGGGGIQIWGLLWLTGLSVWRFRTRRPGLVCEASVRISGNATTSG